MIDIHCHILPGIDDGAANIQTSIEMLRIAQEDGIKTIIATPHYNEVYYNTEFSDIEKYICNLNNIAKEKNIRIEILPGQEVNIKMPVLGLLKEGKIGCLNKTKYMLLELSYETLDSDALDVIYELRIQGIIPVIPHPERYSYIIKKPSKINNLLDEGCLFQINEGSISGMFGKDVKKTTDILISHGICDFIASDAHSSGRRSPKLKEVYGNMDMHLSQTLKDNVEKLTKSEEICHSCERIEEMHSIFNIFKRHKQLL